MTNPTQTTFSVVGIADGHETRTSFPSLAEAREYVEANGLTNNRTTQWRIERAQIVATTQPHVRFEQPPTGTPTKRRRPGWKSRKQREQERQQQQWRLGVLQQLNDKRATLEEPVAMPWLGHGHRRSALNRKGTIR